MSNDQQSQKKKGLTKHRRSGLGKLRQRNGFSSPTLLARAKALNAAHLAGVPCFLYPDKPPQKHNDEQE